MAARTTRGTVGVVGAGQLALMLHEAAAGEAVAVHVLATDPTEPGAVVADHVEIGAATDGDAIRRLASACDAVTFEHELVDLDVLRALAAEGIPLRPGPEVLAAVVDKSVMRRAVAAAGLAVPPWELVTDEPTLAAVASRWPRVALKATRGGYDGRGVHLATSRDEALAAGTAMLAGGPLVAEPLLDVDAELAVVTCRRPGGEVVVYEPVRTVQVDGQCRQVAWPAGLPADLLAQAEQIARAAAEAIGAVGLLAVELFVVDGELLVNELAARPHNTAHHTIEACATSQFANHLRAVLDLPLGPTTPICTAAVMANVIGDGAGHDPRCFAAEAARRDPSAHVHLYGKAPRAERKLGHVTVTVGDGPGAVPVDDALGAAADRAWAMVEALHADLRGAPTNTEAGR